MSDPRRIRAKSYFLSIFIASHRHTHLRKAPNENAKHFILMQRGNQKALNCGLVILCELFGRFFIGMERWFISMGADFYVVFFSVVGVIAAGIRENEKETNENHNSQGGSTIWQLAIMRPTLSSTVFGLTNSPTSKHNNWNKIYNFFFLRSS